MSYFRPDALREALACLGREEHLVLAGGTDIYPAAVGRALEGPVLDITGIGEISGITRAGGEVRIGGTTTWSEIAAGRSAAGFRRAEGCGGRGGRAPDPERRDDRGQSLQRLSRGGRGAAAYGARRRGGAGLCGGAAAAAVGRVPDGAAAHGAAAGRNPDRGAGAGGGAGGTVGVPEARGAAAPGDLHRHGCGPARGGGRDRCVARRSRWASCGPVAARLPAVEARLLGAAAGPGLAALVRTAEVAAALAPIDDARASAAYRRRAAAELLRRAVAEAVA